MTGEEFCNLKIGDTIMIETPYYKHEKGQIFKVEYMDNKHSEVYARNDLKSLGSKIEIIPYVFLLDNFVVIYKKDNKKDNNDYIRIDQLYQHIPTGIVRRVVFAGSTCVTLKDDATSSYSYGSVDDFKKFWKPYESSDNKSSDDKVNHPSHYTWLKDLCGIEVIDIARHMDFDLGNSIKYILRSGHKKEEGYTDKQKTIEDLKKAIWYIEDEIKMLENKE